MNVKERKSLEVRTPSGPAVRILIVSSELDNSIPRRVFASVRVELCPLQYSRGALAAEMGTLLSIRMLHQVERG